LSLAPPASFGARPGCRGRAPHNIASAIPFDQTKNRALQSEHGAHTDKAKGARISLLPPSPLAERRRAPRAVAVKLDILASAPSSLTLRSVTTTFTAYRQFLEGRKGLAVRRSQNVGAEPPGLLSAKGPISTTRSGEPWSEGRNPHLRSLRRKCGLRPSLQGDPLNSQEGESWAWRGLRGRKPLLISSCISGRRGRKHHHEAPKGAALKGAKPPPRRGRRTAPKGQKKAPRSCQGSGAVTDIL